MQIVKNWWYYVGQALDFIDGMADTLSAGLTARLREWTWQLITGFFSFAGIDAGTYLSIFRTDTSSAGLLSISQSAADAYSMTRSCFTGETLVETDRGLRRIDSLKEGDRVLSRSEFDLDGPLEYKTILRTFIRVSPILNLHVNGKIIRTTAEHPFWLKGQGWLAAAFLQPGNQIAGKRPGEWLTVEGVADSGQVETVYNIEVDEHHTYFVHVSNQSTTVWVHNNNGYPGEVGPEGVLVRRGKAKESAQRLAKQAEAAEKGGKAQNGTPYGHGVSVTTPESNAKLSRDPSDAASASRAALESAGFDVRHTRTRNDPNHHTVQLPNPVTQEVANAFNSVLGRK